MVSCSTKDYYVFTKDFTSSLVEHFLLPLWPFHYDPLDCQVSVTQHLQTSASKVFFRSSTVLTNAYYQKPSYLHSSTVITNPCYQKPSYLVWPLRLPKNKTAFTSLSDFWNNLPGFCNRLFRELSYVNGYWNHNT